MEGHTNEEPRAGQMQRILTGCNQKRKKLRAREKTIFLLMYGKGMMSKVDFQSYKSSDTFYPSLRPSNRFHIYHIRRTSMPIQYTGLVANRHTASPNMVHMKPIWAGYAGLERCRWLLGLEIDFTDHSFAIQYQKKIVFPLPRSFFLFWLQPVRFVVTKFLIRVSLNRIPVRTWLPRLSIPLQNSKFRRLF